MLDLVRNPVVIFSRNAAQMSFTLFDQVRLVPICAATEDSKVASDLKLCTVKPVFSNHIKQYIFLAFQSGGCLLLHLNSAESSCVSFLHYFHAAISNHLSIAISMSPDWMVA